MLDSDIKMLEALRDQGDNFELVCGREEFDIEAITRDLIDFYAETEQEPKERKRFFSLRRVLAACESYSEEGGPEDLGALTEWVGDSVSYYFVGKRYNWTKVKDCELPLTRKHERELLRVRDLATTFVLVAAERNVEMGRGPEDDLALAQLMASIWDKECK